MDVNSLSDILFESLKRHYWYIYDEPKRERLIKEIEDLNLFTKEQLEEIRDKMFHNGLAESRRIIKNSFMDSHFC